MTIVEESESSITMRVAFPCLYLTYDRVGKLILTETEWERIKGEKRLASHEQIPLAFKGELGSADYTPKPPPVAVDDSEPF